MRQVVALATLAVALSAGVARPAAAGEKPASDPVRGAVERALAAKSAEEQQAAFDALDALGCRAAPAIGAALDDGRKLPFRALALGRRAGARSGPAREYAPETVTDALAAILSDLTWQHFGFIYNGATAAERSRAVALWRAYLARPLDEICGPEPKSPAG